MRLLLLLCLWVRVFVCPALRHDLVCFDLIVLIKEEPLAGPIVLLCTLEAHHFCVRLHDQRGRREVLLFCKFTLLLEAKALLFLCFCGKSLTLLFFHVRTPCPTALDIEVKREILAHKKRVDLAFACALRGRVRKRGHFCSLWLLGICTKCYTVNRKEAKTVFNFFIKLKRDSRVRKSAN